MKYIDVADLCEDERIGRIGDACTVGGIVGFVVEDEPGKADRYVSKLKSRYPGVSVISTGPGLIPGSVLVRVGRVM